MGKYIYVYFKRLPAGYELDEIEDELEELLGEQGEVTGAGIGNSGGNIDMEFHGEGDIPEKIKSYFLRCGFGQDTILDVNGKRISLY